MKLHQVNPAHVVRIWPQVHGYIERSKAFGGSEINLDQAKALVATGKKTLLVAEEGGEIRGAAIVDIVLHPNECVCFVMSIGGRMIASQEAFEQLADWARNQGCTKISGLARPSVERLWRQKFGFSEAGKIVEKRI